MPPSTSASTTNRRQIKATLRYLWSAWQGHKAQSLLNVALGLILVAADLSFVWTTKLVVDIATHTRPTPSLTVGIAMLGAIIIVQLGVGYASRWVKAALGVKAQNTMRRRLFAHLLDCDWRALRRFHSGQIVNRLEQDVQTVVTFLTETIPSILTTLVQFVGAFWLLLIMDRRLALIVVLVLPFFVLCSKLYVRRVRRLSHDIRDAESRVQSVIQENLQHTSVVKTLELERRSSSRLGQLQSGLHSLVMRRTRYSSLSALIMNAGFATGYLVTFVWGVVSLESGAITYGALIAFIQLVGQIQSPVRTLSRFVPVCISAFTSAERTREMADLPLESRSALGVSCRPMPVGLRATNLTFAYPSEGTRCGRTVIDHLNIDIPPGSVVAIVGETGRGKTTLVRLLLALIKPLEGTIEGYAPDGWRRSLSADTRSLFSYVPQGNTLMSGTIRDNLLMGNPSAGDEEMLEALRRSAADFVTEQSGGLDTLCGEMGAGLSEGQAQRIAIARALLRRRPILLLDEATSALDVATEERILSSLVRDHGEQTVVFITHRPGALRYATHVVEI
ncbi:MAG: ABC transporter ATP-binding protein [Alloprevotella sp.]|nr:ABC transporter ATP-binding protein [Alloprevotella sp.]